MNGNNSEQKVGSFTRFWLWWISLSSFYLFVVFQWIAPATLETDRYRILRLAAFGSHEFAGLWFLIVAATAVAGLRTRSHSAIVAALGLHTLALFWSALSLLDKSIRGPSGGWELIPWILSGAVVSAYLLAKGDRSWTQPKS